ncbi:HTH-type transcriptional activator RhaR [compost metagenome]
MQGQLEFLFRANLMQHTYIALHTHQCYELVYYIRGNGTTRLGDVTYRYQPGMFTIIRPFTPHDEKRETDTDVLFIGFQLHAGTVQLRDGLYEDHSEGQILSLLERLLEELQQKKAFYAAKLNLLVGEMLIELLRNDNYDFSDSSADKMIYARNYIDENLSQKIRVEALADLVGYSYDRFRHLFKEKYNLSPISYLMSKRLERAKRLLAQTDLSISAVAQECGFFNDAQFCALFKRSNGVTPRKYRERE